MEKIFLFNTLSKKKEEFRPIDDNRVGLYTCGPTVYNYSNLGNLRCFLFEDFLKRTLTYNGYKVFHVQNITDVGHLSGDMDMGEDKVEKGAALEGLSAWDLVDKYLKSFKQDILYLNILKPDVWERVSDNIPEQIELIKTIENKGYAYQISDGIYFDTSKLKDYNKLSHLPLESLLEGARVEKNDEKRTATDFALWKFSPKDKKRQMEWDSPWGVGFPGWHIECSAISLKHLKDNLDIHCGGIDHINVHHSNEIAQSEVATGKKFFNYWLHGAFLNILGGKKMAKSGNNFLTLKNALIDKGLNPLAYRLAALQVHYRKPMEYSELALEQSQLALNSFYRQFSRLENSLSKPCLSLKNEFIKAINDDLNMPQALAIANSVFKADLSEAEKRATLLDFDQVLGLGLAELNTEEDLGEVKIEELSLEIRELIKKRNLARKEKDFSLADSLRKEIDMAGFRIEDDKDGFKIFKN